MHAILAARLHIGRDGSGVVVRLHHDQAGAENHEEGEQMFLPRAAHQHAHGGHPGGIELGFCHAHRRNPPASESADAAEAAHGAPVSAHAQASGLFASPVGVQTQARRTAFLTMYSWFFMVPPRLVHARAGTPEAQRRAIRRPYAAHDSWVREGRDGLNEKPPHALNSLVVCREER